VFTGASCLKSPRIFIPNFSAAWRCTNWKHRAGRTVHVPARSRHGKIFFPMSRVHTPITDVMADYVRAVSSREPDALRRQRLSTDDRPDASMQTGPEQGQFLNLLARIVGARKTLEVGVFLGYSSTWVALALPPD